MTRSAIKSDSSLNDKVAGVIHVVQPASGAPAAYRRFFTGAVKALDGGYALASILGNKGYKFTEIVSGLPGPFQLIPFHSYSDQNANGAPMPWLTQIVNGQTEAIGGNVHDLYEINQSPPGIFNPLIHDEDKREAVGTAIAARLKNTRAFHCWLDPFKHPNTYSIYGTGLASDMGTHINAKGQAQAVRRNEGDGTVPGPSGLYLFPNQTSNLSNIPDDVTQASPRQFSVTDVEHAMSYEDGDLQQAMKTLITRILFGSEDP